MKTQYYVASSLDGFIADRENRIDWLMEFGMEEFSADYAAFIENIGVIVMGSRTYEFLLGEGLAEWPYAGQMCWVLTSRELPRIEGADIRFARGDITDLHREWAAAARDLGKDIWIVGGGDVAAQVYDAGLLDELLITIMPVVLGAGAPLLPTAANSPVFEVVETHAFSGGALGATYRTRR